MPNAPRLLLIIQIILPLFFCFSAVAKVAPVQSSKLIGVYDIKLVSGETLIVTNAADFQTGVLSKDRRKTLIVAKKFVPQSIKSVQLRASEDGVSPKEIKILRRKSHAIFYYETSDQFHVYSTIGGQLVISKKVQPNFDFSKLGLVSRTSKRVAGL